MTVGSFLFLKPGVSMGYKLSVPMIIYTVGMFSSIVVINDSEDDIGWVIVAGAGAGAVAGAVAIAGAGAGVLAVAGAGALAIAGALAGALADPLAVAGAGPLVRAGAVVGAVAGAGAGAGVGALFWLAITKIARHNFRAMDNPLPYDLLRLGGLFMVSESGFFIGQIASYFSSGNTLADSCFKSTTDLCNRVYDNLGAHVLFWQLMWHLLKISRPG